MGLTECSTHPGACEQEPVCAIRSNWQRINSVILKALDGISLAEMVEPPGRTVRVSVPRVGSRAL